MQAFTFNLTARATIAAQRGEIGDARRWIDAVEATPPPQRLGFDWWVQRARAWIAAAEGDLSGAIDTSLRLVDAHANELFHVVMGCHDVVRFGAPQLVVDRLAVQRSRPGATWWDNVCADHADAAVDSDGDALFEVAARFEEGGLDLHTAEALAQGIAVLRHDDPGGAVARELHLSDLMHRCGGCAHRR